VGAGAHGGTLSGMGASPAKRLAGEVLLLKQNNRDLFLTAGRD